MNTKHFCCLLLLLLTSCDNKNDTIDVIVVVPIDYDSNSPIVITEDVRANSEYLNDTTIVLHPVMGEYYVKDFSIFNKWFRIYIAEKCINKKDYYKYKTDNSVRYSKTIQATDNKIIISVNYRK